MSDDWRKDNWQDDPNEINVQKDRKEDVRWLQRKTITVGRIDGRSIWEVREKCGDEYRETDDEWSTLEGAPNYDIRENSAEKASGRNTLVELEKCDHENSLRMFQKKKYREECVKCWWWRAMRLKETREGRIEKSIA